MAQSFLNLNRDLVGRSLFIKGKEVIDSKDNLTVKDAKLSSLFVRHDAKVKGNSTVEGDLTVQGSIYGSQVPLVISLPDVDNAAFVPQNATYTWVNLTATRNLTFSNAALTAAYPGVPDGFTVIFDFVQSQTGYLPNVHVGDILLGANTSNSLYGVIWGRMMVSKAGNNWYFMVPYVQLD